MRRVTKVALLAVFAFVSVSGRAHAQHREGVWFGGGGGFGGAQACYKSGCGERRDGAVGYIEAGHTLNEQLLVGGEFNFWSKESPYPTAGDYSRVVMYNVAGTLTCYPRRGSRVFVKGGAGMALIDSQTRALGVKVDTDLGKGFGLVAGAGFDISIGPVALTPGFNYWHGWLGDLTVHKEAFATNHRQSVIAATIGIRFP